LGSPKTTNEKPSEKPTHHPPKEKRLMMILKFLVIFAKIPAELGTI